MSNFVSGMDLYDFSINSLPQEIKNSRFFIEKVGLDYSIIEKINKTHQIVALHPNNYSKTVNVAGLVIPQVLEITFLRKSDNKFVEGTPPKNLFYPNNPNSEDIKNYLIY